MASKRKQEEKHLTLLREMVAKEHNKTCFDCHQRGPTYVNMTIGSFVCTSCSGILRGLNPPNRVKSISMASYTPQEIEYLQNHGNEICRTIWLGLYDSKSQAGPESREENKVRDFMIQKYEKKRWYVEPSQAAAVAKAKADTSDSKADKGSVHSSASSGTPEPKPLRTLVGDSTVPNLVVGRSASSGSRGLVQNTPPATPPNSKASRQPAVDLLGDLGGDPFAAAPAPGGAVAVQAQTQAQGGFADFSQAFGNQATNQPAPQAQPATSLASASSGTPTLLAVAASATSLNTTTVSSTSAFSSQNELADLFASAPPLAPPNSVPLSTSQNNNACDPFQPFGTTPASTTQQNDFGAFGTSFSSSTTAPVNQTTSKLQNLSLGGTATTTTAGGGGGDKYAALTELETLDSGGGIDWNGGGLSSSTSVDWSGGSKMSGTSAVSSSGGINWGGNAMNKPGVSSAGGSTMFGSTSMPNMAAASSMGTSAGMMGGGGGVMGGTITTQAAMPGFGAVGAAPASNPFMGVTSQTNVASNPFLGTAVSTSTAMPQSNGMFGAPSGQFAAQPATSVSYAYGAGMQPATTAAFGGQAFPNQQMASRQMNGGVGTGFGQMPQGQFATPGQGQFAAQGHTQFPAQGQQSQFPTPGQQQQQQAQFPTQGQGQFHMQGQGQYPNQGAVGMPPTSQMPGYGMQQQAQQQPQQQQLTFGGAGMSAMAGMQFQKVGHPQQAGGQLGVQGGFGVAPQPGQQQAFSASWGAPTQQQQPAMTSNPFMASGFGTQAQLPPKTGSSNPFL